MSEIGKRPATVGTMISVPYKLKQRMGKVRENVNWSAIACLAFRKKLDKIAKYGPWEDTDGLSIVYVGLTYKEAVT